ncbi:sulfocyanin [Mycolicibacterium fluoranthenivorans]|uniref:Putative cupredoxin-like copper-binding protein n=1 Tax=Mycolicibacterium fluoranthenivorans TaxID=258505 RepID=A0A7X5U5Q0_9MYCO|nr:sulfocyanin [Mycolicibacterium fluoranthenivorans]MCV7354625.1 sulfocyanin [Mycolicibacterium fluoranthenivorans]NIH98790.1 putative cupredoxin-like copper-binding protein [Mycolicibacterium fluoranthenivorans]
MRSRRLWLVLAIAIASVILGVTTTAIWHASGPFGRQTPVANAPYPNAPGAWGPGMMGPWRYPAAPPPSCSAPALPGAVVDITLADMGAMMGPGMMGRGGMMGPGMMGPGWNGPGQAGYRWPSMGMMRVVVTPASVPAGPVSFRVLNAGGLSHELVVLPLAQGQYPGWRVTGPDGKVDESGSLGEASRTCGADRGDEQSPQYGIAPGGTSWTTITLAPGRYELICNIAGHYWAGMYAELDVTGPPK